MPEPQAPTEAFFERSKLFAELGGDVRQGFTDGAREIHISSGETLLRQGDPITHIYGVIAGRIEAATVTEQGRQLTLDSFDPGDICCEIGVVEGVQSHTELRATENCRLIALTRTKFLELLYSSPEFSLRIFALIDARLRARTEELRDAQLYGLDARLAKRLLLSAERNGDQQPEEIYSHQAELGRRLGVNGEAVNRHLKKWEANGWLKTGRGHISLIDRQAIARIAAPILSGDQAETESSTPWTRFDLVTIAPRSQEMPESGRQSFVVIEAVDYSRLLHTNVKQTIEALNDRIRTIVALSQTAGGRVLSHTGDLVLIGIPEAEHAVELATGIQKKIELAERKTSGPLFRIGVGEGDYDRRNGIIESDAIREATSVAALARHGDVWITEDVAGQLDSDKHDLRLLGEFELRNLPQKVSVYSVSRVSELSAIRIRVQALLPQRYRVIWATIAIPVVLSISFWAGQQYFDLNGPGSNVPANSLVIIPFTYEEGDDATSFIADGIGDELGYRLSAVPDLIVAGLSSGQYLAENRDDVEAVRRAFRVAYMLTGHLSSKDGLLSMALSLRNTASNRLAWSRNISVDLSQHPQIQETIVSEILEFLAIDGEPNGAPRSSSGTSNPDAYRAYLNGNFLWRTDPETARDWYLEALALDPDFAAPYAGLVNLATTFLNAPDDGMPGNLMEMALKAVELAPNSARSYVALAQAEFRNQDYHALRIAIESALALNDRDPIVLQNAGLYLYLMENYDGYFNLVRRAWELNPVDLDVALRYAWSLVERNDIEAAKREFDILARLYPDSTAVDYLANSLAWESGEYRRAYSILQKKPDGSDPHDSWRLIFELVVGYVDAAEIPDSTQVFELRRLRNWQFRFDDVVALVQQEYALDNDFRSGMRLAYYLAIAGRYQESLNLYESLSDQYNGVDTRAFYYGSLATPVLSRGSIVQLWALTKLGRTEDARELELELLNRFERAYESGARDRTLYVAEAQLHTIMGRNAEALSSLRKAMNGVFIRSVYLRRNPLFENLHTEPEFWALIADVEATLAGIRKDIDEVRAEIAESQRASSHQ